jgi:hypothetical protein
MNRCIIIRTSQPVLCAPRTLDQRGSPDRSSQRAMLRVVVPWRFASISRAAGRMAGLSVAVALGLRLATVAAAGPYVFTDAVFNDPDWSHQFDVAPPASSGSAARFSDGFGNPDSYQRITHNLAGGGGGAITSTHINTTATYDPAVSGAITTLDYSEEARVLSTEFSTYGGSSGPALRQGGFVYAVSVGSAVPLRDDPMGALPSPYKNISFSGLTAANFGRVTGALSIDFGSNPDFSASGGLIEFGYVRNNSHTGPVLVTRVHAIDNWSATVNENPPPTILSVAGDSAADEVTVTFSEPVSAATAGTVANYALNGGLAVLAAAHAGDTVTLTTTAQTPGTLYTLSVANIQDLGSPASATPPGTEKSFTPDSGATIVVSTDVDKNTPGVGLASLREAITAANNGAGLDTIGFNIAGGGVRTITPSSALPTITDTVVLDGYTQPGASANTLATGSDAVLQIALDGSSLGGAENGLAVTADGCTIRGLVIHSFPVDGIEIVGGSSNTIEGNFIGTDAAGGVALGNDNAGVRIRGGATGNLIGGTTPAARNLLSASPSGVRLHDSGTSNNSIEGNYIGTTAAGTASLANTANGVTIDSGASGNTVGGLVPGAGNLISGNAIAGVSVSGATTTGNVVQGNLIGTDPTGTSALANGGPGVRLQSAPNNIVGGASAAARNTISGNLMGVFIVNAGATGNSIQGNYIGTSVSGASPLPNLLNGISVQDAPGNAIGGALPGEGNVISANAGRGISITGASSDSNTIRGNKIGTSSDGLTDLGNNGEGVFILSGFGNVVGGTLPGEGNVISGNGSSGVHLTSADGNFVHGNIIGADLNGNAANANLNGVVLEAGADNNDIGGTSAGARNIISGNAVSGVLINVGANANRIRGNYIGLNATGDAALPNVNSGVRIEGASIDNEVGGEVAGAGNVISGNNGPGVLIFGSDTTGTKVQGNLIGLRADGVTPQGNGGEGVRIDSSAEDTLVGGVSALARNVISGNSADGVIIAGASTSGNQVKGNYIGLDASGAVAVPNGIRGVIVSDAPGNVISDGNVISGNFFGIQILGASASGNTITGNVIGLNAAGLTAVPNFQGINILGSSGNLIGGTTLAARNIISGNTSYGVLLDGGAFGNHVLGNFIGTRADGTTAAGNGSAGVVIDNSDGNSIGGSLAGEGNVISGNGTGGSPIAGVYVFQVGSQLNTIAGNKIGTDATGTVGVPNTGAGVLVNGASQNAIGGSVLAARNIISANSAAGVHITGANATANEVLGNHIGTDSTGLLDLGNGGDGVYVDTSPGTVIGGLAATPGVPPGNVISGNSQQGVFIQSVADNSTLIQGNILGLDANGDMPLGNSDSGVRTSVAGALIGGSDPMARNVISGNQVGVSLSNSGSLGAVIQGNYIGTDLSGMFDRGNASGGVLVGSAPGTTLIDNLISGNGIIGVQLFGISYPVNAIMQGNTIGLNAPGNAALGNDLGIRIANADNVIGGTLPSERNVISGNATDGIQLDGSTATANQIQGNYVGLDAGGTLSIPNAGDGFLIIDAGGNTIGGTTVGARNVISGNGQRGIRIAGPGAAGNLVQGNYIGLDASGTSDVGNILSGIQIHAGATANFIGGAAAGAGNVIAANLNAAVHIFGSGTMGNTVAGNIIGLDATATAPFPNGGSGWDAVFIEAGASDNTIGGTVVGAGNVIAGNAFAAVSIKSANAINNRVQQNSMFANAALGIDLNGDGVTPNDAGDADASPNHFQNFPVISSVLFDGLNLAIQYVVDSADASIPPNTGSAYPITVEFFIADSSGEGQIYLGSHTYTTPQQPESTDPFVPVGSVAAGQLVVATATDADGNTSEFSAPAIIVESGYVVTNTSDSGPGSLRQAIMNANANAGTDTIQFAIPGSGPHTIQPWSDLPTVADPVIIDGYTQPGASVNTLAVGNNAVLQIELDGSLAGVGVNGLVIDAGNSTVRGLVINRFQVLQPGSIGGDGIVLRTNGDNVIEGNFIGTDAMGTLERENGSQGLRVLTANNLIGGTTPAARNVISGNQTQGIGLSGNLAQGNRIQGNYLGTDKTGTARLPNSSGVTLGASNNTIGGTAPGAGNVISGNFRGVYFVGNSSGNVVQGNFIGTDPTGTMAVFNTTAGIEISSGPTGNIIGGTAAGARNIISGNRGNGVWMRASGAENNQILGNFIGTDVTGTAGLGNEENGVHVNGAADNTIGGTDPNARNIISANVLAGVLIESVGATGNQVFGNYIGTDLSGTLDLGNSQNGVIVRDAANNTIGGTVPGAGNVISGNTAAGVAILQSISVTSGNVVQGNVVGTTAAGNAALPNGVGVVINGAPINTIGGATPAARNIISANNGDGVTIEGATATGNLVQGNYIGTDLSGTLDLGNAGDGVHVFDSSGNTIGGLSPTPGTPPGNLISGNNGAQGGIYINTGVGSASNNSILGNVIGLAADGVTDLGNTESGIFIDFAANNLIGGAAAGARNVISGNNGHGVLLNGLTTTGTLIKGNYIGTTASGAAAALNTFYGIFCSAPNNLIGGTEPGSGNVVSSVQLRTALASGNTVQGNLIGTDVSGTLSLGAGVRVDIDDAPNNLIGGTTPAARNVISGNTGAIGDGVRVSGLTASGNVIRGNFIGTDITGALPLGNVDNGILILGAPNTTIGAAAGGGNQIAFNGQGVRVQDGIRNRIQGNSIHDNTLLGIELDPSGVNANDPLDADGSPNMLQNFPDISRVTIVANTLQIDYAVNSSTIHSAYPLTVDFYRADTAGEEGAQQLFSDTYTAPEATLTKSVVVPLPPGLTTSDRIVATATDADGNTSEFSLNGAGTGPAINSAPTVSSIASQTILQNGASPVLNFTIDDADPGELSSLSVAATSSNPAVIANNPSKIQLGGSLGNRTIQLVAGPTLGVAEIKILVTDAAGFTSSTTFNASVVGADCADNITWLHACPLGLTPSPLDSDILEAGRDQSLEQVDQTRWYKFSVQPGSRVVVELTGLPANYDLVVYKDIQAKYNEITALATTPDLALLNAEFAPEAYSPEAYSPEAYSPEAYSPEAYSPEAYSPEAYSPEAYSPEAYSPEAYSPEAYSPEAYSPEAYSPEAYSPEAYSPEAYSPEAYSPEAYSPEAYSDAQTRCVLGVSAFAGLSSEGLILNTWDNTGTFYVRVRGRNGAYRVNEPFHLSVRLFTGACGNVAPISEPSSLAATAGGYETVVLADFNRLEGTSAEMTALQSKLGTFMARPEVKGVLVNVGADARVAAANAQGDANRNCVFAKNLVAEAIRDLVLAYRDANPGLKHVVIIGNDDVIPFFRHPDQALLAAEQNYFPPVLDNTHSQAALRLSHVLSQDDYGAVCHVSLRAGDLPLPELGVGRLVETAPEISGMLDAYLVTAGGVVPNPDSSLVTGYDFLADVATEIHQELLDGIGAGTHHAHIAAASLSPQSDPDTTDIWTAQDLREDLLDQRYSLIFLAGHFTASSLLASDYKTRLLAAELASTAVDLRNSILLSSGCHAGYNIVDAHGVPGVTIEPDWARACAIKGMVLIAGTGYQYGDTDFIEYSERLYFEFARRLRIGTGPVAIGDALVDAKRKYLAETAQMRGIHAKALLQTTLFGLPMLKINLPGTRLTPPPDGSIVAATTAYDADPGETLGLSHATVTVAPSLNVETKVLEDIVNETARTATYVTADGEVLSNPSEPVLPLATYNVSMSSRVLRGVGFRAGAYDDTLSGVLPLTGAPTTEARGVHGPFLTEVHFPIKPWNVNYYDALCSGLSGATRLLVNPAQYISATPGSELGTFRRFSSMTFKLFYSANATYTGGSIPTTTLLSDAPSLADIQATAVGLDVTFSARAHGNVAAGIQEVWVTYTATAGPLAGEWQSFDLTQQTEANVGALDEDSTLWKGTLTLPAGASPADVRFIVQAVNGLGLVTLSTRLGAYHTVGLGEDPVEPPPTTPAPTVLTLLAPPDQGKYSAFATFKALLTDDGAAPLPGRVINFSVGSQDKQALTDPDGIATVHMQLMGLPGAYDIQAAFKGDASLAAASASAPFAILKQDTALTLAPSPASACDVVASLRDVTGQPLGQKTVFFVVHSGATVVYSAPEITDYSGNANLGAIPLPPGSYTLNAHFMGAVSLLAPEPAITLADDRYNSVVSADYALSLAPAPVTVSYTGPVSLADTTTLHLSALVSGAADPSMALVEFRIYNASAALVASVVATVAPDGIALGLVTGLPVGAYTIQTQVIGNCYGSPTVTTGLSVTTSASIPSLKLLVQSFGLHKGTENGLVAKLNAANAALNAGNIASACGSLQAFINEVYAQTNKKISIAQANLLIPQALQLRALLGCP